MKNTIIVVECISSSVNYIKDIMDEGYEPVLLELGCSPESYPVYRINHDFALEELFTKEYPGAPVPRIIQAGKDYDETLEIVRKLYPKLIVPGGDDGIEMAMKLSHDLGLVTNDPENFGTMRNKYLSQQALKKAGVRYIKSKVVKNRTEADKFFEGLGGEKIVLKPIAGAASVGVHICRNREEYRQWINSYSDEELSASGVLMQEYIMGKEYVCNSVSCEGHHKITALMSCEKKLVDGYSNRYDTYNKLDPLSEIGKMLIKYAFKVLDAVGIQYGPVHSEIMVDKNGPVLIETNCRLCGAAMKARWMDRVFGNHESDVSLSAYLHPGKFFSDKRTVLMDGKEYGVIKFLAIDHDMYVRKSHVDTAFKDIPGFMYACKMGEGRTYFRTVDLSSASGMVYLADKDPNVVKQALNMIDDIQKNHPELLYECK